MDHSLAPPIKKQNTIYQKLIANMKLIMSFIGTDEENTKSNDTIQNLKNGISSVENQSKQSNTSEHTIEYNDNVNVSTGLTKSIASINFPLSIFLLEMMNSRQASETEDNFGIQTLSQFVDEQATKSAETIKNYPGSINDENFDFTNGKRASGNNNKPKAWSTGTIVLIILSIIAVVMGTSALIEKYSHNQTPKYASNTIPQNPSKSQQNMDKEMKSPIKDPISQDKSKGQRNPNEVKTKIPPFKGKIKKGQSKEHPTITIPKDDSKGQQNTNEVKSKIPRLTLKMRKDESEDQSKMDQVKKSRIPTFTGKRKEDQSKDK